MTGQDNNEELQILRGLFLLRLVLLAPFFLVIVLHASCKPAVMTALVLLLLFMAVTPVLVYFLRRSLLAHPAVPRAMVLCDFLLASLLAFVANQSGGLPVFFPLYFLVVAVEAACWWSWPGALISGAAGAVVLSLLYMNSATLQSNQGVAMIALVMAWPIVLGYFTQWALRQWRERRHLASWMARQEDTVRQVRERLDGWGVTCLALQGATSPRELLERALHEAMRNTASSLGLIVSPDAASSTLRAEIWAGFALSGPDKTTLRPADRLPASQGQGLVEVRHVLEVPLGTTTSSTPDDSPPELGRMIVARDVAVPYTEEERQWMQVIASYTAALLENRFLRGQLGRIQEEADSIVMAASTLTSLRDPAAAIEMACRNVLSALNLEQVIIFLYGGEGTQGRQVIVYPARGPARAATISLQGRGLRLLRRFLDGGAALIVNRRNEMPEIFDLMGWGKEVQAAACFPLYVLQHRWGAICLLAKVPDAFPSQTQQNLAIFSGEVAMALENFYLRQSVAGAEP